jgi:hypothetical protein
MRKSNYSSTTITWLSEMGTPEFFYLSKRFQVYISAHIVKTRELDLILVFSFFGYLKRDAVDVEMRHSWFLAFGHQKCPRIAAVIVCWVSFIGNEEDPMILQHPHFSY